MRRGRGHRLRLGGGGTNTATLEPSWSRVPPASPAARLPGSIVGMLLRSVLAVALTLPVLSACSSSRPTTYAERLATVADDYERDLARVERILESVRPLVPATPSTPTESELAASVRRADMALELAHDALTRARLETSGDQMRHVAAYSQLALEYANAANAFAPPTRDV